jgi:hypothetical protein
LIFLGCHGYESLVGVFGASSAGSPRWPDTPIDQGIMHCTKVFYN